MFKIRLDTYIVQMANEAGALVPTPYKVKESLVSCFLHPALSLTGRELLLRAPLATRIEEVKIVEGKGEILVEDSDYEKLQQAFETIQGFTRSDMELVRRVLEAEKVEVKEKEGKEKGRIKGGRGQ